MIITGGNIENLYVLTWGSLTGLLLNNTDKRGWTSHSYRMFGAIFKNPACTLTTLALEAGRSTFGTLCEYLTNIKAPIIVLRLGPGCHTPRHVREILKSLLVNFGFGLGRNAAERLLLEIKQAITLQFIGNNGAITYPTQATLTKIANIVTRNNDAGAVAAYRGLIRQRAAEFKLDNPNAARKRPRVFATPDDV